MNYHEINKKLNAIKTTEVMSASYEKWLNDPMTQDVIAILTVLGQPQSVDDGVRAYGWAACLNKMQQLAVKEQRDVEPTYEDPVTQ